jgi:hypothetical protein
VLKSRPFTVPTAQGGANEDDHYVVPVVDRDLYSYSSRISTVFLSQRQCDVLDYSDQHGQWAAGKACDQLGAGYLYDRRASREPFCRAANNSQLDKDQGSSDTEPTIIERDINGGSFRIFEVAIEGNLTLEGLVIQKGFGFRNGGAIRNMGTVTLQDSVVTNSSGDGGTISNTGTLKILRSIISDNFGGHDAGAIANGGEGFPGGTVLIEDSTISHNGAIGAGGIANIGASLTVKNSAIVFNHTDGVQFGGGIANVGGSMTITNSTIAKNMAGGNSVVGGGGGVYNTGFALIINTTIRENIWGALAAGASGTVMVLSKCKIQSSLAMIPLSARTVSARLRLLEIICLEISPAVASICGRAILREIRA